MNDNAHDVLLFKALGDETRLHVMELLRSGEKCACVLLEKVDVGQPTLSHHMKILVDSGIVSARKAGKWTYYSISPEGSALARNLLERIITVNSIPDNDDNVRCCE
ncbi:transcriptional regulator [Clostridia bacterium]|nr:transcriptional regulator [Clostridia bacterium]